MSDLNDFPTDHIMVIRIPAIADLGVVHQGDHLIAMGEPDGLRRLEQSATERA